MDRVLQSTPATASVTYYEDGVAVDPGTVTVQIDRADGTSLVAAGTATSGSGTAARTFALTTTHTALLDRFKLTWTSATKGVRTTYIEIVGGFLFLLPDLDALLKTPSDYTAAQKTAARTWAEVKIEQAIGRGYVPRYAFETIDGPSWGRTFASLTGRPLRTLRSIATRSGSTWTTISSLTAYDISYSGVIGNLPSGYRNLRVGYEYGEDFPQQDVADAAALWAKVKLVQGPVDDRELQRFIIDTGATINLATPGRNSWSGIPEVDSVIDSERAALVA